MPKRGADIPESIRLLDLLIANYDRHSDLNWLRAPGGRAVAIDHDNHSFGRYGTRIPALLLEIQNYKLEIDLLENKYNRSAGGPEKVKLEKEIKAWDKLLNRLITERQRYEAALVSRPDSIAILEKVSETEWRKVLSQYLESHEVDGFLKRRREILSYIQQIKDVGEIYFNE